MHIDHEAEKVAMAAIFEKLARVQQQLSAFVLSEGRYVPDCTSGSWAWNASLERLAVSLTALADELNKHIGNESHLSFDATIAARALYDYALEMARNTEGIPIGLVFRLSRRARTLFPANEHASARTLAESE